MLIFYKKRSNISKSVEEVLILITFANNAWYFPIFKIEAMKYMVCFYIFEKGFNKIWHKGLIHKLEQNGIGGPISSWVLICINDLSDGFHCNRKLLADDTSLFAIVHNINKSTNNLNNESTKIRKYAFQWQRNFNPDASKQAHEITFLRSLLSHPILSWLLIAYQLLLQILKSI